MTQGELTNSQVDEHPEQPYCLLHQHTAAISTNASRSSQRGCWTYHGKLDQRGVLVF